MRQMTCVVLVHLLHYGHSTQTYPYQSRLHRPATMIGKVLTPTVYLEGSSLFVAGYPHIAELVAQQRLEARKYNPHHHHCCHD